MTSGDKRPAHRKKKTDQYLTDENCNGLPDFYDQDQNDVTPRGSSAALVAAVEGLDLGDLASPAHETTEHETTEYETGVYEEAPPLDSPDYNYHSEQVQVEDGLGTTYGDDAQSYVLYSNPSSQPSGKGKGRATRSESSHGSRKSSKHGSHNPRRSSNKKSSSSKAPAPIDAFGESSQMQFQQNPANPSAGEEGYYLPLDITGTPQMACDQSSGLATVPEAEPLSSGAPVDQTQTEPLASYGQYGEVSGPSASSGPFPYCDQPSYDSSTIGSPYTNIPRAPSNYPASDRRYQVHKSSRFKPGKVIKLEWVEKAGAGLPRGMNASEATEFHPIGRSRLSNQSRQSYWTWRRFIVVNVYEGFIAGVPIYTYQHQGCKKPGCKPNQHGIVHDARYSPRRMSGEPRLGFRPVKIKMAQHEQLDPASRANYCKTTNIECNVAVMFIGEVASEDYKTVLEALNEAWSQGNSTYPTEG